MTIACNAQMEESSKPLEVAPAKGYLRLKPEWRARMADLACGAAALLTVVAMFPAPQYEGIWLRLPVLLAQLVLIVGGWLAFRRFRAKVPVAAAGGMVVGIMGVALLAMALHKVNGWISLSGLVSFMAALALRGASGRAMIKGRDLRRGERNFATVVVENVEGLAAALVLVLLVWHFGLEAFRIPTGSMAPTLLGDVVSGDRVLVDKFVYQYRDPERWEPVVFRYPLRRTDPYVKRCIALPGEQVLVAQGDVYVKRNPGGEIELLRKSPEARDVLWLPLLENLGSRTAWVKNFHREGDADFDDGSITLGAEGAFYFPRGETGDEPGNVTDHDASFGATKTPKNHYNRHVVGDLRIRAEVTLDEDGELFITIVRDEDEYTLVLGPGQGACRVEHKGTNTGFHTKFFDSFNEEVLSEANLEPGESCEVEFSLADGELTMIFDSVPFETTVGTPLLDQLHERDRAGNLNLADEHALRIASTEPADGRRAYVGMRAGDDSGATVRLLGVDRDIYYVGRTQENNNGVSVELPFQVDLEGERYLVLGDNSPGSADCRSWTRITLFMDDGTQVTGALDPASQRPLVDLLAQAGDSSGLHALGRLLDVAQFSPAERPAAEPDGVIVQGALRDLKDSADRLGRAAIDFYTEGGGYVRVRLSEIESIQVQPHPYVERRLFVGRPFAVFLSPRGMKLID